MIVVGAIFVTHNFHFLIAAISCLLIFFFIFEWRFSTAKCISHQFEY